MLHACTTCILHEVSVSDDRPVPTKVASKEKIFRQTDDTLQPGSMIKGNDSHITGKDNGGSFQTLELSYRTCRFIFRATLLKSSALFFIHKASYK